MNCNIIGTYCFTWCLKLLPFDEYSSLQEILDLMSRIVDSSESALSLTVRIRSICLLSYTQHFRHSICAILCQHRRKTSYFKLASHVLNPAVIIGHEIKNTIINDDINSVKIPRRFEEWFWLQNISAILNKLQFNWSLEPY